MPRFQLTGDRAQVFEIGDRRYEVPVRGVIEIPAELAFVVARRGLPLVAVEDLPAGAPKARVVIEGKPPASLLAQLPVESREGFLRHWEDCASQIERSALLREIQRWIAERAAEREDDEEPVEPEDDETPATAPAVSEDDVDAQLAAVARRGRRRVKE